MYKVTFYFFLIGENQNRSSGERLFDVIKNSFLFPSPNYCSVSGPLVASCRGLAISLNPGIQILQNLVMSKKVQSCIFPSLSLSA